MEHPAGSVGPSSGGGLQVFFALSLPASARKFLTAKPRSEEEKCELEDEEGEQLHFVMEPILKEMKDYKRPGRDRASLLLPSSA